METLKLRYKGDCCPNCANIIEEEIKKLDGVDEANISVMTRLVKLQVEADKAEAVKTQAKAIFDRVEPSAQLQI